MSTQDTGKVRLPAIPPVDLKDPGANRWAKAVTEWIQVRGGVNGNPFERAVTLRELTEGVTSVAMPKARAPMPGEVQLPLGNGLVANISIEQFSQAIRQTPLYRDLTKSLHDPSRFDGLAQEVKSVLLRSILDEAAKRGADISRVETKIQDQSRSLAMVVEEITASITGADAGIRQTQVAFATAEQARAELITQLEARLLSPVDDADKLPLPPAAPYATLVALLAAVPVGNTDKFYRVTNPAPDADPLTDDTEVLYVWDGAVYVESGFGSTAKLEQRLMVEASKTDGLRSQYTLKLSSGGALAGFGAAAETNVAGESTSAFIIQAGKFALISDTDTVGYDAGDINPVNPDLSRVPFGVDAATGTVYINGSLRIGSPTGTTLDDVTQLSGVSLDYTSQFFKYDTAGAVVNSVVTLTASVSGAITGTLTWSVISGYSGAVPSAVTVTAPGDVSTATIAAANMTADTAAFKVELDDGGVLYSDLVTLVKLRDGADAYSARLTNDSAGVACDSAGAPVVGGFGAASGVFEVYKGANKLTSGVVYSVNTNTNGLTASINSTSGAYSVTAKGSWPDVTKTAVLKLQAAVTGGPTLIKDFSLTKNLQGVSGYYTDYVFYRTAGAPPAPPSGWSDTPPAGTDPLYMSSATREVLTNTVVSAWSTAARLDGTPGTDGADGADGSEGPYQKYQWAVNTSSTTAPTSGWNDSALSPSTGQFLWMHQGTVTPPATTPSSYGTAYRVSGEKGEPGVNTATIYAYQRSSSALLTNPGAVTYSFTDKAITTTTLANSWQKTIPTGTDPLWVVVATAQSSTDTDGIMASEWSAPVKLADNGVDGLNSAPVMIYARTATATAPTITGGSSTFTFTTGVLTSPPTGNATWTQATPTSGGAYLWIAHASAASTGTTDTITYTEWSTARLVAKDGVDGVDGDPGDPGESAKVLRLTSTGTAFLFTDENATTSTSGTITITAALQNVTGTVSFDASAYGATGTYLGAVTLSGTGVSRTVSAAQFVANAGTYSVVINASLGGASDRITVYRVNGGMSALYAELTNGAHNIPTDADGNNPVYTNSGTEIRVYEGDTLLSYLGTGTSTTSDAAGTWRLDSTNSTKTGITLSSTLTDSGAYLTVGVHSGITADTASIKYMLIGKSSTGAAFTLYATQTFAKAKQGAIGKRGTRQLYATSASYTSGYASYATQATSLIATATAGTNPTTPIKGDTVTFTNGTDYTYTLTCTADGSNWSPPGVVIDGNLLVTGTVTATKMAANSITAVNGAIENLAVNTLKIANNAVTLQKAAAYSTALIGNATDILVTTTDLSFSLAYPAIVQMLAVVRHGLTSYLTDGSVRHNIKFSYKLTSESTYTSIVNEGGSLPTDYVTVARFLNAGVALAAGTYQLRMHWLGGGSNITHSSTNIFLMITYK